MANPTVTQASFTGGEFSPELYGRTDLAKYKTACRTLENFFVHPHGGASNRGGTRFVGACPDGATKIQLVPFQFSVDQGYVLEMTGNLMRIIKDGGYVVYPFWHASAGEIVEVVAPWAEAAIGRLQYAQTADVMYVCHPNYPPQKISRTGHHVWTITEVTFAPSLAAPTGVTESTVGSTHAYVVTSVASDGSESVPSSSVTGDGNGRVKWTNADGASYYNIYKSKNNTGTYYWVGDADDGTKGWQDANVEPDTSKGPPGENNPFEDSGDYPGSVCFHDQRLWFARTNNQPQTVWASVTGDYENMNTSVPLQDDDSLEFTAASQRVTEFRWLVPMGDLLIGGSGSEWRLYAGGDSPITPTSANLRPQDQWGSAAILPVVIGTTLLFVDRSGKVVRDFLYSLDIDGYNGTDLTILASHIFVGRTIVDWCYQQSPYGVVWCVLSDGTLAGLTYMKEQDVWAWHRHSTNGEFKACCSLLEADGSTTAYFVVKREIEGADAYYVELLADRMQDEDLDNAGFLDSAIEFRADEGYVPPEPPVPTEYTFSAVGLYPSFYGSQHLIFVPVAGDFASGAYLYTYHSDLGCLKLINIGIPRGDHTYKIFQVWTVAPADGESGETLGYLPDMTFAEVQVYFVPGSTFDTYSTLQDCLEVEDPYVPIDPTDTLTGLDHLEGETVTVFSAGSVNGTYEVIDGEITLPEVTSRALIGLPFTAKLETMELDLSDATNTLQSRSRSLGPVVARFRNTREFWYGQNFTTMYEMPIRTTENYGSPPALYTGDKQMFPAGNDYRSARLCIEVRDPVPVTILAAYAQVVSGAH